MNNKKINTQRKQIEQELGQALPTIDSDIPLPEPSFRGRKGAGYWRSVAGLMKNNDSVLVCKHSDHYALSQAIRQGGSFPVVRKIAGEGWRVWKVATNEHRRALKKQGGV